MSEYVTGSMTISSVVAEDDQHVRLEFDGDLSIVEKLGMLELAKDTVLRQIDGDDE